MDEINKIMIKSFVINVLLLLSLGFRLVAQTVVYEDDFTDAECGAWQLPPGAAWVEEAGERVLQVQATGDPRLNNVAATRDFDFSRLAAPSLVVLEGEVKYAEVTRPQEPWNGVKFMMVVPQEHGRNGYFQAPGAFGDSDWRPVRAMMHVTEPLRPGRLVMGLQDATGRAWFRRLKMTITPRIEAFPPLTPEDFQAPYTARVKNEPVRRGAMSPLPSRPGVVEEDLPVLRAWGANLLRWQLVRYPSEDNGNQDCEEYLDWVRANLPGTLRVLDRAQELGMKVVVDLHMVPGGRDADNNMPMFDNAAFAAAFQEAWRLLATACKGHPALFGYDLVNEPCQAFQVVRRDYLGLQYDIARMVREIDPETPIIIESNEFDSATAYSYMSALPLPDIIYQVHCYAPFQFTHQGVKGQPAGLRYPNPERGWNREMLREYLRPVREFQLRHGARIYVGEFSAIRWAPGAEEYLRDCIALFEEYGWDWSYHAFREWDGWSVEHGEEPDDHHSVLEETTRKRVLLNGFRNNWEKESR